MTVTENRGKTNGKRVLAFAMAAVLAASMCPSFAFASQLEAGSGDLSTQALSTQASKKTVYVVTSVTSSSKYSSGMESGSVKNTTKYTYNKKGLVTKHTDSGGNNTGSTTYTYKGNNVSGMSQKVNTTTTKVTYTLNKKGQATKAKYTSSTSAQGGYSSTITGTVTATYKSGNLVKRKDAQTIKSSYGSNKSSYTYSYTYKDGRVASYKYNGGSATSYTYDKNGNMLTNSSTKYKSTYNAKKQVTKRVASGTGYSATSTYKYKAIKVPASVASKVEAQQWAIVNGNYNFAFGISTMY